MAEGQEILVDFKDLFEELGTPEGTVKIKLVNDGASKFGPAAVSDPISLGRAIINDVEDRLRLGLTDPDVTVVKMYGAALEASGLYQVTEDSLRRAKLPGGGVVIYDRHYTLKDFLAGFRVGDYVMTWLLTCVGSRGTR